MALVHCSLIKSLSVLKDDITQLLKIDNSSIFPHTTVIIIVS